MSYIREKINDSYLEDEDASQDFTSDPINITFPIRCLSFQGFGEGNVSGTISVEVSIIPDRFITLTSCEPMKLNFSKSTDFFFIIPDQANYAGAIRLKFEALPGSTGSINCHSRIMPL